MLTYVAGSCCCSSSSSCGLPCGYCEGQTPVGYRVEISGLTNGACANFNGTWVYLQDPLRGGVHVGGCIYDRVGSDGFLNTFGIDGSGLINLIIYLPDEGGSYAEFSGTYDPAGDCFQVITLHGPTGVGGDCVDDPGPWTAILTPFCECGRPCSNCPGLTPSGYSVEISGLSNGECAAFNGQWDYFQRPENGAECIYSRTEDAFLNSFSLTGAGSSVQLVIYLPPAASYGIFSGTQPADCFTPFTLNFVPGGGGNDCVSDPGPATAVLTPYC